MANEQMVLVRIKRLGKHFASCGVGVRPPEDMIGTPGIKRRCPKLVPGVLIRLPISHNLLNQPTVEIVRRAEPDEIIRPWVFDSAEAAVLANPHKTHLTHDQIESGLMMKEGAELSGRDKLAARVEARKKAENPQTLGERIAARRRELAEWEATERLKEREALGLPGGMGMPDDADDDGYIPNIVPDTLREIKDDAIKLEGLAEFNDIAPPAPAQAEGPVPPPPAPAQASTPAQAPARGRRERAGERPADNTRRTVRF